MPLTQNTFLVLAHPSTNNSYRIGTGYIPESVDMPEHVINRALDEGYCADEALDTVLEMQECDAWTAELFFAGDDEWFEAGPLDDVLESMRRVVEWI